MDQGTRRPANSVSGTIRQIQYAEVQGEVSISGIIPDDNTIPQIGEGTQFLSVSITPKKIGNKLLIELETIITEDANTNSTTLASIFKDGAADAIAVAANSLATPTLFINGGVMTVRKQIIVTSLSAINFTVRGGVGTSGNSTVNRLHDNVAVYNLGGILTSSIKVMEIEA